MFVSRAMEEDNDDSVLCTDDFFGDNGSILSEDLSERQKSNSSSSSCLNSDSAF